MGHRSTVRGRSRQQGLLVSSIVQIDKMTKLLIQQHCSRSFDLITLPGRAWSKPTVLPAGQRARLLFEGDPRAGASRLDLVLGKGGQAGQEGELGARSLFAFLRGQYFRTLLQARQASLPAPEPQKPRSRTISVPAGLKDILNDLSKEVLV